MRFYEFNEAEGDSFPIQVYKAMMAADEKEMAQRAASQQAEPASGDGQLSTNIKSVSGGVDPNQIASYLKSKGLSNNHIVGILTNIKGESGFRPGILGDGNTSGGLFQHHGIRFTNMVKAVGSDWQTDWKGQIDFALSEPKGVTYTKMSFRTPESATEWWTRYFEVPKYADADVQKRVGFISQFT